MWAWLIALVGAIVGAAIGLFGPVLIFGVLGIGTGSYEDVLFIWFVAVPGGFVLGAWQGFRLGRRLDSRRQNPDSIRRFR
jgi:hypothetical protein